MINMLIEACISKLRAKCPTHTGGAVKETPDFAVSTIVVQIVGSPDPHRILELPGNTVGFEIGNYRNMGSTYDTTVDSYQEALAEKLNYRVHTWLDEHIAWIILPAPVVPINLVDYIEGMLNLELATIEPMV